MRERKMFIRALVEREIRLLLRERDIYIWCGGFIAGAVDLWKRHSGNWCGGVMEATFRHSLAAGEVRGIAPRERGEEVGEPFSLPFISVGVSRRAYLSLTPYGNA